MTLAAEAQSHGGAECETRLPFLIDESLGHVQLLWC